MHRGSLQSSTKLCSQCIVVPCSVVLTCTPNAPWSPAKFHKNLLPMHCGSLQCSTNLSSLQCIGRISIFSQFRIHATQVQAYTRKPQVNHMNSPTQIARIYHENKHNTQTLMNLWPDSLIVSISKLGMPITEPNNTSRKKKKPHWPHFMIIVQYLWILITRLIMCSCFHLAFQ